MFYSILSFPPPCGHLRAASQCEYSSWMIKDEARRLRERRWLSDKELLRRLPLPPPCMGIHYLEALTKTSQHLITHTHKTESYPRTHTYTHHNLCFCLCHFLFFLTRTQRVCNHLLRWGTVDLSSKMQTLKHLLKIAPLNHHPQNGHITEHLSTNHPITKQTSSFGNKACPLTGPSLTKFNWLMLHWN